MKILHINYSDIKGGASIAMYRLHEELNKTKSGGTPYGPSHVENFNSSNDLTKDEYEIARKTGIRLSEIAIKINA